MAESRPKSVALITGAGGMGLAIARRLSGGRLIFLGDFSPDALSKAKEQLETEGHFVQTHPLDVSSPDSVTAFASAASQAGTIDFVIHTAGLSPAMAAPKQVLAVDLLGTALVIDAFQSLLAEGRGSMVCVASMAGYMLPTPLSSETERHFALAPTAQLLDHAAVREAASGQHPGLAYSVSKRANQLRVQAAAPRFGERGCRINSISPGVIHTAMVQQEMAASEKGGEIMRQLADNSSMGRFGTAADVVNIVSFLTSSESGFITGSDFLVDGGSIAAQRWGGEKGEYDPKSYDRPA